MPKKSNTHEVAYRDLEIAAIRLNQVTNVAAFVPRNAEAEAKLLANLRRNIDLLIEDTDRLQHHRVIRPRVRARVLQAREAIAYGQQRAAQQGDAAPWRAVATLDDLPGVAELLNREAARLRSLALPGKPLLTDTQRKVYDLIVQNPDGITGSQIIRLLAKANYPLEQSTLTRHIIPVLKRHYRVVNQSGIGYSIRQ